MSAPAYSPDQLEQELTIAISHAYNSLLSNGWQSVIHAPKLSQLWLIEPGSTGFHAGYRDADGSFWVVDSETWPSNPILFKLRVPEVEPKLERDDLITVCDHCLRASCWQGIFYCDNYAEAGTIQKTRSELIGLNRENQAYFKTDTQLANESE